MHHPVVNADSFFSQAGFMPHGHCYLWNPTLVGLHVTSDLLIGLAYLAISITLYAIVKRVKLRFSAVVLCFGIFIAACGLTHLIEIWTLWRPDYWFSALIKMVTALASVFTGVYLYRLRHEIVGLASAAKLSEQRRLDLETLTRKLEQRVSDRTIEVEKTMFEYSTFFTGAPVGLVQIDPCTRAFTRVNPKISEILGYDERELLRMTVDQVTHPDDLEACIEKFQRLLTDSPEQFFEKRYVRKDGRIIWGQVGFRLLRDRDDQPDRAVAIMQDVTESREARILLERKTEELQQSQRQLEESERRNQKLIETLPQLVWTCLPDGRCDYLSRQWVEYTGVAEDEQLGIEWLSRVIHPDDRARTYDHWMGAVAGRHAYDIEYRIRARDGEYRWFKTRGVPVHNTRGETVYWFGTCTDVHEQRTLIERLENASRQLAVVAAKANEANELKSAFLATMSHEIRTPLGAILGFTELVQDVSLGADERASFHRIIKRNGEHLSSLINDILDLSKVEAGQFHAEIGVTDISRLVEEICATLTVRAKEKFLELHCSVAADVPPTLGTDEKCLLQILTNLVGNAIKFTPAGRVEMRAFRHGEGEIGFRVTDTGIGISPAERSNLFQPFSQADPSITRRYGGTGLGLVLSRRLAKELGGDLVLEKSEPGQGSTFMVWIKDRTPRALVESARASNSTNQGESVLDEMALPATPTAMPIPRPVNAASATAGGRLAGLKVLIVDDSPDNRFLVANILVRQGAQILEAENGREGFEMALAEGCDVVLMDISMPVMDGYSATRQLREAGFRRPVIALTAHAMDEVRTKTQQAGCDGFLTKPLKVQEMLAKIEELVQRP